MFFSCFWGEIKMHQMLVYLLRCVCDILQVQFSCLLVKIKLVSLNLLIHTLLYRCPIFLEKKGLLYFFFQTTRRDDVDSTLANRMTKWGSNLSLSGSKMTMVTYTVISLWNAKYPYKCLESVGFTYYYL